MSFFSISRRGRFSWFFVNFMILWKLRNSWNSTFSSKSGSQNTWFPIGNQSYSACWAMHMSISWNFMKFYEISWNLVEMDEISWKWLILDFPAHGPKRQRIHCLFGGRNGVKSRKSLNSTKFSEISRIPGISQFSRFSPLFAFFKRRPISRCASLWIYSMKS